jgi:hypothetical protein
MGMDTKNESPVLYSVEDAAIALGKISGWTLRKHLKRGNVSAVRIGRRLFVNSREVRRIQDEGLPSLSAAVEEV